MKCRECGEQFRKKKRTTNMGTLLGGVEIRAIRKHVLSCGCLSREFRMGSLIEGRFVYTVEIRRFLRGTPKPAPTLMEIENRTPDFA